MGASMLCHELVHILRQVALLLDTIQTLALGVCHSKCEKKAG